MNSVTEQWLPLSYGLWPKYMYVGYVSWIGSKKDGSELPAVSSNTDGLSCCSAPHVPEILQPG